MQQVIYTRFFSVLCIFVLLHFEKWMMYRFAQDYESAPLNSQHYIVHTKKEPKATKLSCVCIMQYEYVSNALRKVSGSAVSCRYSINILKKGQ